MDYLVDTSILARLAQTNDPHHQLANNCLKSMKASQADIYICSQNLIEFRNVASRATEMNGLGWPIANIEKEAERFELLFDFLPDASDVFSEWKDIVQRLSIIGAQVHDARLYAFCRSYGMDGIVTFNTDHFRRFQKIDSNFDVIDPRTFTART